MGPSDAPEEQPFGVEVGRTWAIGQSESSHALAGCPGLKINVQDFSQ